MQSLVTCVSKGLPHCVRRGQRSALCQSAQELELRGLRGLARGGQGPKGRAAGPLEPLEAVDAHLLKALAAQICRPDYVVCSTTYDVPPATSQPAQSMQKARVMHASMSCVQEGVKV